MSFRLGVTEICRTGKWGTGKWGTGNWRTGKWRRGKCRKGLTLRCLEYILLTAPLLL